MNDNPLIKLEAFGQSIWMDFIQRGMIASGQLKQLIEEDGLCGVTSNPSIFEKAIAESHDYDEAIRALALEGKSVDQIYAALTVEDIQRTADLFRPVYDRLNGADGFVSLEVSPYLAHDAAATIADARRLWAAVARPNAMIKEPSKDYRLFSSSSARESTSTLLCFSDCPGIGTWLRPTSRVSRLWPLKANR